MRSQYSGTTTDQRLLKSLERKHRTPAVLLCRSVTPISAWRSIARFVYRGVALEQIFVRWFGPDMKPSEVLQAVYLINAYPD
jgi:hypothetical protein